MVQIASKHGIVRVPHKMIHAGCLPLAAYWGGADIGIVFFDTECKQGQFCTWGRSIPTDQWTYYTSRGFNLVTVPGSATEHPGLADIVAELLIPEDKEALVQALLHIK